MPQVPMLRKTNTSGYVGVSWHATARKWGARIKLAGRYQHLGLFRTPEEAHTAYVEAALQSRLLDPTLEHCRKTLLSKVYSLYIKHGMLALETRFLHRQPGSLYLQLRKAGLTQPAYLQELGLTEIFATWRKNNRTYRGETKPQWTWEEAVVRAREIKEREGSLPTLDWFRHKDNGLSSLVSVVFKTGHTWQDLRVAVGCTANGVFVEARNKMRWRSRPEASLSNFLHARGIEHRRGDRYGSGYTEFSGRRDGRLDMHFRASDGAWIDVEIWGDMDFISHGRYSQTRALKEAWQAQNARFLGIEHRDCFSDARLSEILRPHIGLIEPFTFERPYDPIIQTVHWTDADELLETCAAFAARMPEGIFPSEDWLRKRGRYASREGESYRTLAHRVNQWLGGTRKVREILGHPEASTTKWSPELAVAKWNEFTQNHGLTPSQCHSAKRRQQLPREVTEEASAIHAAATRHGVFRTHSARQEMDAGGGGGGVASVCFRVRSGSHSIHECRQESAVAEGCD